MVPGVRWKGELNVDVVFRVFIPNHPKQGVVELK